MTLSTNHGSYATLLETYTLSEIIELNDITEEEVLEYLVVHNVIKLPSIRPLEFNEASY